MSNNRQEIQEKLRRLREAYAVALPDKVSEINQAWQGLLDNETDSAKLQRMIRLCHSLAGSGSNFGFPEVSRLARQIEHKLLAVTEQPGGFSPALSQEINRLLMRLKKEPGRGPQTTDDGDSTATPSANVVSRRLVYIFGNDDYALELAGNIRNYAYTIELFDQIERLEQQLQRQRPAAIILVTSLQDENNLGLINRFQEFASSIPIALVTDMSDTRSRLTAIRNGINAYFTKPVDIISLIDVLDNYSNGEAAEPYRILIVEDAETLAESYASTLQQAGMQTCVITDAMQVMDTINEFSPELILMDLYMPQCSGTELAELIRQQESSTGTPIVFLSAEDNIEKQLSAMQHGGDDFLTKPLRANHLVTAVTCRAKRFRKLRSLMFKDSLTGLYNHTSMAEILERELERAARSGSNLSYAMIDIDHFKMVNDRYGHAAGDNVIKALSLLLRQRLRKTDYVGRYGGEEFAVIMPDTDATMAMGVIEDIRSSFADLKQLVANHEIFASFSAGIADLKSADTAASLAKAADKAMYEAKQQGRNRVVKAGVDN